MREKKAPAFNETRFAQTILAELVKEHGYEMLDAIRVMAAHVDRIRYGVDLRSNAWFVAQEIATLDQAEYARGER